MPIIEKQTPPGGQASVTLCRQRCTDLRAELKENLSIWEREMDGQCCQTVLASRLTTGSHHGGFRCIRAENATWNTSTATTSWSIPIFPRFQSTVPVTDQAQPLLSLELRHVIFALLNSKYTSDTKSYGETRERITSSLEISPSLLKTP